MKVRPEQLTDKGWQLVCGEYLREWWDKGMRDDDAIYSQWFLKLTHECSRRRLAPWKGTAS